MTRSRVLLVSAVLSCTVLSLGNARAVVGGHPADAGEYPWVAAIYTGSSPSSGQYCGGSLVTPLLVVTAAHCVTELVENVLADLPVDPLGRKVKAMIGRTTLTGSSGDQIVVRRLHVHPDADSDMAVLELSAPSTQTPIAWARPQDEASFAPGVEATVAGWGATREGGAGSNRLLEAQVPIISDASCFASYGSRLTMRTELCAGYPQGGTDTCQGDSGGPLMVPHAGGWLLAGLTSWGDGCARPNKPGVYAEVAAMSGFIEQFD